uniref:Uncharacterized protein n=1 Tax=Romanomermis culicivorax TaxID=13658 RepID=A0A915KIT9_ROMCU
MAVRYTLSCLGDTKASNYPATEEKKEIIREIHREYQMEMDRQAKLKKKKSSTTPTQPAILPKFQMKPAPIITTAGPTQGQAARIRTSLGAAQRALTPCAPKTIQMPQMPTPGIAKVSKKPMRILPIGRGFPPKQN